MNNALLTILLIPFAYVIGAYLGLRARAAWLGMSGPDRSWVWNRWVALYTGAALLFSVVQYLR